ncbi:class I SAM-dependent methyltransferase [Bacteroidota bacterium]
MNRTITNIIRFIMDECIPPIIRDNKYFMYPFFYYAYRGKNIKQVMDFKKLIHQFTEQEYNDFYNNLDTISRNRQTDLSKKSLNYLLNQIDKSTVNLLDVGCGNGYLLHQVHNKHPQISLSGMDLKVPANEMNYQFISGKIESIPVEDHSFDIVTCTHTLEHIINVKAAVAELKRITCKQLIIVVPRQRYFYYTLDEHVNFFHYRESLTSLFGINDYICQRIGGDWIYIAQMIHK